VVRSGLRPLGRRAEPRTIRFFADDPAAALGALPPLREPALESRQPTRITPSRSAARG
jgi:hypothetical protein